MSLLCSAMRYDGPPRSPFEFTKPTATSTIRCLQLIRKKTAENKIMSLHGKAWSLYAPVSYGWLKRQTDSSKSNFALREEIQVHQYARKAPKDHSMREGKLHFIAPNEDHLKRRRAGDNSAQAICNTWRQKLSVNGEPAMTRLLRGDFHRHDGRRTAKTNFCALNKMYVHDASEWNANAPCTL